LECKAGSGTPLYFNNAEEVWETEVTKLISKQPFYKLASLAGKKKQIFTLHWPIA